jgi:nitrogen fixation NifU-like protein
LIEPEQARRWQDSIVDHSQFPRRHHAVTACTHEGAGDNPLCGDRVTVQLRISEDGVIEDIGCQSVGCAISIASASMLAASLMGVHVHQARERFEGVHELLLGQEPRSGSTGLGDLESLRLVRQYPSRVKCASLAWHALNHALNKAGQTASTE